MSTSVIKKDLFNEVASLQEDSCGFHECNGAGTAGKEYGFSFSIKTGERVVVLIVAVKQTGGDVQVVPVVLYRTGGIATSATTITSPQNYKVRIDVGNSAWQPPMVLYSKEQATISNY